MLNLWIMWKNRVKPDLIAICLWVKMLIKTKPSLTWFLLVYSSCKEVHSSINNSNSSSLVVSVV